MAIRVINFTTPADTVYRQLYALLAATTGAIPARAYTVGAGAAQTTGVEYGILPDRVQGIRLSVSGNLLIADSNYANSVGFQVTTTTPFTLEDDLNTICLKDIYISGNTITVAVQLQFK